MSAKQTERNQGYQQNDVLKGKMGKKLRCLYFYVDDSGKNSQSKIHEEDRARQFRKKDREIMLNKEVNHFK